MAGIFGDDINNREEFFERLAFAEARCQELLDAYPDEDTLASVQAQLQAIRKWTENDRTPLESERESLDMALRMFREYEMTDNVDLFEFRDVISGIHSYVEHWPSDHVAADPNNDDYL